MIYETLKYKNSWNHFKPQIIIKQSNISNTFSFFLRFSLTKNPSKFFLRLLILGTFFFSIAIRLAESPANRLESPRLWNQCIWHTLITMITIGYGDTTPNSYFGRIVSVFCGIFGYCFFSLLIISIKQILSFNKDEETVCNMLGRVIMDVILEFCLLIGIGSMCWD